MPMCPGEGRGVSLGFGRGLPGGEEIGGRMDIDDD